MRKALISIVLIMILTSLVAAQKCPLHTTEGELLKVHTEGYDPDPEIGPAGQLIWSYPSMFDANGTWRPRIGDAGVYHLEFGLSDGELSDSYRTCLEVFPRDPVQPHPQKIPEHNNPPILLGVKDMKMYVGETLHIRLSCTDIDGDDVSVTYYGWPGGLDYTAALTDVGTHMARVECTDEHGLTTARTMFVQVLERGSAPVIPLDRLIFYEGDVIDLTKYVYDLDTPAEKLRFTATGVFERSLVWYTSVGDRGNYTTILSVSDGESVTSRQIEVIVLPRPAHADWIIIDGPADKPAERPMKGPANLTVVVEDECECEPCDCSEPDYPLEVVLPKEKKDPCSKEPDYPVEVVVKKEVEERPCAEPDYPLYVVYEPEQKKDPCSKEPDYPVHVLYKEEPKPVNCIEEPVAITVKNQTKPIDMTQYKNPCTNYII